MSNIDEYIYAYTLLNNKRLGLPDAYRKRDEIIYDIHATVDDTIGTIDYDIFLDRLPIAVRLFDELLEFGSFKIEIDDISGAYYKFVEDSYSQFRKQFFSSSRIVAMYQKIGSRYFPEVFEKFAEMQNNGEFADSPNEIGNLITEPKQVELIPAANRMVSLNHNAPEYEEVRRGIDDAIEKVTDLKTNRLSVDEKTTAVSTLKSIANLWESYELNAIHLKVGVIIALENVEKMIGDTFKMVSGALLVDFIKAAIKAWTGLSF